MHKSELEFTYLHKKRGFNINRDDLLFQIALWYYEDGLDQKQIGERVCKSRSMVSRLLQEARSRGIIEVRVNLPLKRNSKLEKELVSSTCLNEAWILESSSMDNPSLEHRTVAKLGASALQRSLRDGLSIGVAWSRTLYDVISEFPPTALTDTCVVQMSGSVALGEAKYDGPELVRGLAKKTNGDFRYLVAPLLVNNQELRDSLIEEYSIAETLEMARRVDIAIVGIGTLNSDSSTFANSGLLSIETMDRLRSRGVAGDIIGRQFKADGTELDDQLNSCVISIELQDLRNIENVMAVAYGKDKVEAICGALRGCWVNTLVSDTPTIKAVMDNLS